MSATNTQGERYVMPGVKALRGMLPGSYQVEMNFSGCCILIMVLLIDLFKKPTPVRVKRLFTNFFTTVRILKFHIRLPPRPKL